MKTPVHSFQVREIFVLGAIIVAAIILLGVAFNLQVISKDFHTEEADKRHIRTFEIPAERGIIYDRHGSLLALSTPMASIWVDPKEMLSYANRYRQLLDYVQLSDAQFNDKIEQQRHRHYSFIDYVSEEQSKAIRQLNLNGVYVRSDTLSFERNNRVINVDGTKLGLWVNKRLLDRYRYSFDRLAKALDMSPKVIQSRLLKRPNSRFMYLKRLMRVEQAQQIERMNLTGVFIQNEYRRYYPAGEVAGNLIGFTNIDDQGIEGLERTYESHLRGVKGSKKVVKSRDGLVIDFIEDSKPVVDGKPIVLSIDQNIQYFTYKALKAAYVKHQAASASAVVLDAKTGEILAMASLPGFNPNAISQRHGSGIRNRAVADLIEPGSTIKPFTIAKALDLGIVALDEKVSTSNGVIRIKGARITDTKPHGDLTPTEIIQKSSNVGTARIAIQFDPDEQYEYWEKLGFNTESGNYLPGEAVGQLKGRSAWEDPVTRATAAYGYGFNTSLLALARAYTLFANEGRVLPVSILKVDQRPQGVPVVSAQAAKETLKMMEEVVKPGGTATQAQVPGYSIAGKTGTVHQIAQKGGYAENTYVSVFAGLAPASNPDMVMVVAVNEPSRGVYYGGAVAAPVFKKVMQNALRIRAVAPDGGEQGE